MADVAAEDWRVLVLSGPPGSGKASVAQALCRQLPDSVHIPVFLPRTGQRSPDAATWLGGAKDELAAGRRVIFDDALESEADLTGYRQALAGYPMRVVALLPGSDELARRDALRPTDLQLGRRVEDVHQAMWQQLTRFALVLDTSGETVDETAARILKELA